MAVIDTLKFARALREAGVPSTQAEATATAINDAFTVQIATKDDLTNTGAALRSDIANSAALIRSEMQAMQAELRGEIQAIQAELRGEMQAMEQRLRADIANVRTEMLRWMMAQTFTLLAAIAALLHFVK